MATGDFAKQPMRKTKRLQRIANELSSFELDLISVKTFGSTVLYLEPKTN